MEGKEKRDMKQRAKTRASLSFRDRSKIKMEEHILKISTIKNKKNMREYSQIDILKCVLAILIVLRHCGQVFFPSDSMFMKIMNILSPIAVPTFFTLSGFLFFSRKKEMKDLKKYILRLLKLYILWTLVFLPFTLYSFSKNGVTISNSQVLLVFMQKFLFDGSYYHLWFLPSLVVAIVIVFLLSNKISDFWLLAIGFVLFVIGTLVATYSFLSTLLSWHAYKTIFITTRNGIFFGIPFVTLGKLIAEKKVNRNAWVLGGGIALASFEGFFFAFIEHKSIVNMTISSIVLIPEIVMWILYFPSIRINGKEWRNASTLIFCAHPIAISLIGHFFEGTVALIIVMIVVIFLTFVGVKLSDRISILKHFM